LKNENQGLIDPEMFFWHGHDRDEKKSVMFDDELTRKSCR
jgi:hypothetical protein